MEHGRLFPVPPDLPVNLQAGKVPGQMMKLPAYTAAGRQMGRATAYYRLVDNGKGLAFKDETGIPFPNCLIRSCIRSSITYYLIR